MSATPSHMARAWLLAGIVHLLLGGSVHRTCRGAEDAGLLRVDADTRKALFAKWGAALGGCDFARMDLYMALTYLHPRPPSAFRDLGDLRLPGKALQRLRDSVRYRFTEEFRRAVATYPSGYFLSDGSDVGPSLLLHEFELDGHAVTIQQSRDAILVSAKPPGFSLREGVGREDVARLILKWLKRWENEEFGSLDEISQAFQFPYRLKLGETYANGKLTSLLDRRGWGRRIIVFVGKPGICFLRIKLSPYSTPPQPLFPCDYYWLNKNLYMPDGKTLVDPRYRDKGKASKKRDRK